MCDFFPTMFCVYETHVEDPTKFSYQRASPEHSHRTHNTGSASSSGRFLTCSQAVEGFVRD